MVAAVVGKREAGWEEVAGGAVDGTLRPAVVRWMDDEKAVTTVERLKQTCAAAADRLPRTAPCLTATSEEATAVERTEKSVVVRVEVTALRQWRV